jgi:hypothetical protein
MSAQLGTGIRVAQGTFETNLGTNTTAIWINVPDGGNTDGGIGVDISQGTQEVHAYVDGGTDVVCTATYSATSGIGSIVFCTVSGYLIDTQ